MNQELIPNNSTENLSEKDIKLNELANKFERVSRALHANQTLMIRMADSEIPDEHAEVRTEVMAAVKEQLQTLSKLILEIEQADGIIDANSERGRLEDKK